MLRFIFFQVFGFFPSFLRLPEAGGGAGWKGEGAEPCVGLGGAGSSSAPSEMTAPAPGGAAGHSPHYIFIARAAEGPIKAA